MRQYVIFLVSPAGERDDTSLCRVCSLYCLHVLLSHVKLKKSKIQHAGSLGILIEVMVGDLQFHQPRVLVEGKACTGYEARRMRVRLKCRRLLLTCFNAAEMAFKKTPRYVKTLLVLTNSLQNESGITVGSVTSKSFLDRFELIRGGDIDGVFPLSPAAKLDLVALRIYFYRYFRNIKPVRVGV